MATLTLMNTDTANANNSVCTTTGAVSHVNLELQEQVILACVLDYIYFVSYFTFNMSW